MKKSLVLVCIGIFFSIAFSQESKEIKTNLKVYGNCDQCKTRIENAVKIDEVKYAKWNKSNKMLTVIFNSSITADSLQKRIANVGHDTEKFKADDETYSILPDCCLYRGKNKTH